MTRSQYREDDDRSYYGNYHGYEEDRGSGGRRRDGNGWGREDDHSYQRRHSRPASSSGRSVTSHGSGSGYKRNHAYRANPSMEQPRTQGHRETRYRKDVDARSPPYRTSADAVSEYSAQSRRYASSEEARLDFDRGAKPWRRASSGSSYASSTVSGSTVRPQRSRNQRRVSIDDPRRLRSSASRTSLPSRDSGLADILRRLRVSDEGFHPRPGKLRFDGIVKKNGQMYRKRPKRPQIRGLTKAEEASILEGRKMKAREERKARIAQAVFEGLTGMKIDRCLCCSMAVCVSKV